MKRKRFDPNEIIIHSDYAEMLLYHKNQTERCRTFISLEDVTRVSSERWFITEHSYVRCCLKDTGTYIFLHRFILNAEPNTYIDHVDRNKLNNKRENLRICNHSQNGMNKDVQSNSSTGTTGVNFDKRKKMYRAYIKVQGKQIFLGYFINLSDAITKRKQAELHYFKEFAVTSDRE